MGIIDQYIIKNFLKTLFFMIILIMSIFLVVDIQGHYQEYKAANPEFTIGYTLINYYPYYCIWAINLFASILVFIAAIYFTSRITDNTEIVAITSAGASFFRVSRPYLIVALFVGGVSLITNHYLLPWANVKKNEFIAQTVSEREKYKENSREIASQVSDEDGIKEYLFIKNYTRENNLGSGFYYTKINTEKKEQDYVLRGGEVSWNKETKTYELRNFFERTTDNAGNQKINNGTQKSIQIKITPDELLPESYVAETMTTPVLKDFIKAQQKRGADGINTYKVELYQRTSMPVAVLILTFLALSLGSVKKRGGIGSNLAIGITCAFIFIFSFQVFKSIASGDHMTPWLAVWLPNIIFGIFTLVLYIKRARM